MIFQRLSGTSLHRAFPDTCQEKIKHSPWSYQASRPWHITKRKPSPVLKTEEHERKLETHLCNLHKQHTFKHKHPKASNSIKSGGQRSLLVSPGFPPQQLLRPAEVCFNISARLHGSHSSHANFSFQDVTERPWYTATGFLLLFHQKTPSGLKRDIPKPCARKHAGRWLRGGEHFFI